jgi:hypothetical protein
MSAFAALGLFSGLVQASAMAEAGRAERRAAERDAFNIETEKVRSKVSALQRHNDRLEAYRNNLGTNIARFSKLNRADTSVSAFLQRNREVAFEDIGRSDLMGMFEASKLQQQANATRSEGRAREQAAKIEAFTTAMSSIMSYQRTMANEGSKLVSFI